eukprot:GHVT01089434.1.p1 GENE.GHVT01089434.1~~GHVT01089434.1.p1  ORF type:complete len:315 (-),score=98.72 GHVT01089434.1:497-1441(-)
MPTSPASASAMSQLGGSIVALVTPMKAGGDDAVDFEAMAALVKWHMTQKTQGIVVMGTTGEAPTATEDEWAACVSTCVAASGGALPVIAGTGTNCTASTVAKTKRAVGLGANGALVVTPYYNKPTQEGMFAHFSAVANAVAASNFPIILYNVPGRTAVDLLPETVERLASLPNVMGIKEAGGKIERFEALQKVAAKFPNFKIYSGDDALACDAMLGGAHGVVTVTGNVQPALMQCMCAAALRKDKAEAKALDGGLAGLHRSLFTEPNPSPVKFLLQEMKKIEGGIRLPLLPCTKANQEALRTAMLEATKACPSA